MSAFSWRCQYCSWAFQISSESVAAALAVADATQARHHVEHCPRCRKALKIPVDQLRHHAPINAPAASPAPTRSLSFKEDEKTMNQTPAPLKPIEPIAPIAPITPAPAPLILPPPPPAVKKPVVRKPAKKVVRKAVKKGAKKSAKKAVKKPVKKAAKKNAKKKGKR